MVRNSAFVFIKPHAVTDKVKELVKETFQSRGIDIKKEGELDAADIDKYKKIDKHYYAIASKATILTPDKLAVPADKFKEKFGLEWDEVLKEGKALNAMDACAKFEIDSDALDKMWADCKKAGDLVKFGGGFYCGKLEPEGKGTWYVFNGFFMSMRSKFVVPGASIYYYVVEWEGTSWGDFRGKVLGPTDPATAPEDSLRGMILKRWKDLGLTSEPNTGDNGVHASASPFEALAERMNWLGYRVERDPFGKQLIKGGIPSSLIREWSKDPQVTFGPIKMTKSLFDTLEDTDSDWCAALCQMIANGVPAKPPSYENEIAKLEEQLKSYEPLGAFVKVIANHSRTPQPSKVARVEHIVDEKPPLRRGGAGKSSGKGAGKSSGKGSSKGAGKVRSYDDSWDEPAQSRSQNRNNWPQSYGKGSSYGDSPGRSRDDRMRGRGGKGPQQSSKGGGKGGKRGPAYGDKGNDKGKGRGKAYDNMDKGRGKSYDNMDKGRGKNYDNMDKGRGKGQSKSAGGKSSGGKGGKGRGKK